MKWKPIETAPKDGRLILGWDASDAAGDKHAKFYYGVKEDSDGDRHRVAPYEVICWIDAKRSHMEHVKGDTFRRVWRDCSHWARSQGSWNPTHWMPLPEPPTKNVK